MSLVLTQRPIVDLGDNESPWNAVGNPIVYKFQRKDFVFNQVNNSSGFVQLQFNGIDLTSSFANGDQLYVKSDNGVYNAFGTQTAESFGSGNTLITTDIPYTAVAPGGFANNDTLRKFYKVSISGYDEDGNLINSSPFIYSPDRYGALTVDVYQIIRTGLNPNIDIDLTTTGPQLDSNAFQDFKIGYTEVWIGSSESETVDTELIYGVLGARQIPSQYGGNMVPYVVFEDPATEILNDTAFNVNWTNQGSGVSWTLGATELNVTLANQTSKRARRNLSFTKGNTYRIRIVGTQSDVELVTYNFYVGTQSQSFLYEDGAFDEFVTIVPTENATYFEIEVNVPGLSIEIDITNVTVSLVVLAKWLTKLTNPKAWIGYPFILSAILTENTTEDWRFILLNSDGNYDIGERIIALTASGFTSNGTALITEDISGDPIIEQLTVTVHEPCANPVMLLTRNTLGGALQWLFEYSQEYTHDYGNGRKAKRKLLSVTGLTINEWEALEDFIGLGEVYRDNIVEFTSDTIKTSSRIGQQVYEVFPDGSKIGVIVIPTRNSTLTKQIKHTFEIEIEYPEEFVP